jgi:hypothetical protein
MSWVGTDLGTDSAGLQTSNDKRSADAILAGSSVHSDNVDANIDWLLLTACMKV